jgi:structural maintenance of chromosomes protein 5
MSPQTLLVETQKCAGDARLSEWHEKLIELKNKEKRARMKVDELKDKKEDLETKNKGNERDVIRWRDREQTKVEVSRSC